MSIFFSTGSIPEVVAKFISRANFSHEVLNRPRGLVISESVEMAEEPLENIHVRFEEQFLGKLTAKICLLFHFIFYSTARS